MDGLGWTVPEVTVPLALKDCWASDELLDPQERISSFFEAKKSQVMVVLPQNTATKVSNVMKLAGESRGRNTKYWCPEENI